RESESRYRRLVENMNDGLTVVDDKGAFLYVNDRLCEMLGYSRDELVEKNWRTLFDEENKKIIETQMADREKGVRSSYETAWITKNGRIIYTIVSGQPIFNAAGKYEGAFAVITDITERKLAEQQLKESEETYRLISENMNDLIVIVNEKLKIEYVNKQMSFNLMGYSKEEIIGKSALEFVHPDDIEVAVKAYQKGFETGEGIEVARARHKNGYWVWMEVKGKVFKDQSGIQKLILIAREITERKEAEERLRESEEKHRFIIENANDLIGIMNQNFEMEYFNEEAVQKVLGYSAEELLGKNLVEYVHPDDRKRTLQELTNGMEKGEGQVELRFPTKEGNYKWIEARGRTFLDKEGDLKGIIIARDITERKKLEQELRESEEKYKNMVNLLPEIIFEMDTDFNLTYMNPMGFVTFGYSQKDFEQGLNILQMVSSLDLEGAKRNLQKILMGETSKPRDYLLKKKDGTTFYARSYMSAIMEIDKIVGIRGAISDITERKHAEQQLKESEEKYRFITENMDDMISIIDHKFKIEYMNEAQQKLTGFMHEELMGKMAVDFLHPNDIKRVIKMYEEGVKAGVGRGEFRMRRKDGSYIWVDVRGKAMYDEKNNLKSILVTRDIDKQKKLEKELQESKEKFKEMVDLLPDIIFETDADLKLTYANPIAFKKFGYTQEEFERGLYIYQMISPKELERARERLGIVLRGEMGVPQDFLVRIKDGSEFYARIYVAPIIKEGKVAGIRGVVSDISRRKQVEEKLRESEEQFKMIAEQSLMGIVILQDDIIKYANEATTNISEYPVQEILTWPPNYFINLVHPEDAAFVMDQARKKQAGELDVVTHYYYRLQTKSGNLKWISQYSKSVTYQGRIADLITMIDITKRREAEEDLRESEKQFREAYNRAEFYKDLLSHDISNILQSILFTAESGLLMLDDKKNLVKRLNDIKDQIKRCGKIVSDVRKLSKLEKGEPALHSVEIFDVLEKSMDLIKKKTPRKEVHVKFDSFDQKIHVQADEFLRDVFDNILDNAVKYNNNQIVEVLIRITKMQKDTTSYIKVEFMDNGFGIKDSSKKAIFARGYREDKNVSGRGLGLSLSLQIIKGYSGQIWVEDRVPGKYKEGSNFIILIPEAMQI
ncbi:MAG: PAS domain S-box protein, partial [Promethearchaeota archaeon]